LGNIKRTQIIYGKRNYGNPKGTYYEFFN
jgi:hypothetical protein